MQIYFRHLKVSLVKAYQIYQMADSNKHPMQRTHQNKQDEHKAPQVKFGQQQEAVKNVSISDILSLVKQMNSLLVNSISAPKYPTSPQPNFWFDHSGQLSGHYPTAGKSLLKFGSFNAEGLRDKTLDPFFINFIQDFDFLTLVETWLPPNSKVNSEGFYSFSTFRKKHRQAKKVF